jgi:hypothetical protein
MLLLTTHFISYFTDNLSLNRDNRFLRSPTFLKSRGSRRTLKQVMKIQLFKQKWATKLEQSS